MRAVYCIYLFCIAVSEVTAVLLEDLFLPSQARTLAEVSKWRLFFFFVVKIPQEDVFFSVFLPFVVPLLSCHLVLQRNPCRPPWLLGFYVLVLSPVQFLFFFSFPTGHTCVCAAGEITLNFIENLCFGPPGPPTSLQLWNCELDLQFVISNVYFIYCIYRYLIYSIDN